MKTLITILIAAVTFTGCSQYAFKDLGDGQGGWGGVPLKDTVPAGLNAMAANANMQAALANERAARAP